MEISKDERELYDRQIRLWGLEGQKRLRNSRILIIGMGALAVELAKNLCLAGVGAITLQSSQIVTEDDLSYNFFLDTTSIGENAAIASATRVQRLNPRVAITTESARIEELTAEFCASFDVLIATQSLNRERLIWIDEHARKSHRAFYYASLQGWGGFSFVDSGVDKYKFVVEKEVAKEHCQPGKVTATQEILSTQEPTKESDSPVTKSTLSESYCSFEKALNASTEFGESLKMRHRNKISPWLPAFIALLKNPENPDIIERTDALGLPKHIITPEFLETFKQSRGIQISGMASVLGGTLSQEVINFLTSREYPIQNIHIYDGSEGKGPQYYLTS